MILNSALLLQIAPLPTGSLPKVNFRPGQHAVTTAYFSNGQTDFTKKIKLSSGPAAKNIASCPGVWLHPAVQIQPPATAPVASRRRLNIFYSGRVQGVGFRYAVKTVAAGFEVAGTVRNLPDGRVELVAEGTRAELEAFRAAIRTEGLAGFIHDEAVTWGETQYEFRGFEISR
jgi:acylphosphatase